MYLSLTPCQELDDSFVYEFSVYNIEIYVFLRFSITARNLSPYQLMSEDNKPVVPHSLSHNIVVYGEDESEAYRSQATQFSRVIICPSYVPHSSN